MLKNIRELDKRGGVHGGLGHCELVTVAKTGTFLGSYVFQLETGALSSRETVY